MAPGWTLRVGRGRNSTFSEYGYLAYQIKGDDTCSNMIATILSVDHGHILDPRDGVKRSKHIFSESSHVAYQIKGNGE